ncbi:T9SS type A sorting domain-containing protein [Bacteroidota bacterium]
MLKHLILIFLFLVTSIIIIPQSTQWQDYSAITGVLNLDNKGDSIYLGTNGGIVEFNRKAETVTQIYNKTNSNFCDDLVCNLAVSPITGELWSGSKYTAAGISRCRDGKCMNYTPDNSNLEAYGYYTSCYIEECGRVWMGSHWWLSSYNGNTWTNYEVPVDPYISYNNTYGIVQDNNNTIWVAYAGIEEGKENIYSDTVKFLNGGWAITVDNDKNHWYGGGSTIYSVIDDITIEHSGFLNRENKISTLKFDSKNNLWIASDTGLVKYDGKNWERYYPGNSSIQDDYIADITIDDKDNIWISYYEPAIITKFDGESTWKTYNINGEGLTTNIILNMAVDNDNNAWVATYPEQGIALSIYNFASWEHINKNNIDSLLNNDFCLVYTDTAREIWAKDEMLLEHVSANYNYIYNADNRVKSGYIKRDSSGNYWIALPEALVMVNNDTTIRYDTSISTIGGQEIDKIAIDSNNNIIINTLIFNEEKSCKLLKFNGDTFEILYNLDKTCRFTHFVLDKDIIWAGADVKKRIPGAGDAIGLIKITPDNATILNYDNSGIPALNLTDIAIDIEGKIWLSTFGAGIASFNKADEWVYFHPTNSYLGYQIVDFIETDNLGNLWIVKGHQHGLQYMPYGAIPERGDYVFTDPIMKPKTDDIKKLYTENIADNIVQNIYPNPFSEQVNFILSLVENSNIEIKIYNSEGKKVHCLSNQNYNKGTHTFTWNAKENNIKEGIYVAEIFINNKKEIAKLLYMSDMR